MRARADLIGGRLEVRSQIGIGTEVDLEDARLRGVLCARRASRLWAFPGRMGTPHERRGRGHSNPRAWTIIRCYAEGIRRGIIGHVRRHNIDPPHAKSLHLFYSWDDDAHKEWVLQLATRLRRDGVEVTLDQWHLHPGDQLPAFMERAIQYRQRLHPDCVHALLRRSARTIALAASVTRATS